jgi:hypothetical protein
VLLQCPWTLRGRSSCGGICLAVFTRSLQYTNFNFKFVNPVPILRMCNGKNWNVDVDLRGTTRYEDFSIPVRKCLVATKDFEF